MHPRPRKSELWTTENEVLLIEHMRRNPFIWDSTHRNYNQMELKKLVYRQIAAVLGRQFTGDMVKDRWCNMKTTFAANYKRAHFPKNIPTLDAKPSLSPTPSWTLYSRLSFLEPTLAIRHTVQDQQLAMNDSDLMEQQEHFVCKTEDEDVVDDLRMPISVEVPVSQIAATTGARGHRMPWCVEVPVSPIAATRGVCRPRIPWCVEVPVSPIAATTGARGPRMPWCVEVPVSPIAATTGAWGPRMPKCVEVPVSQIAATTGATTAEDPTTITRQVEYPPTGAVDCKSNTTAPPPPSDDVYSNHSSAESFQIPTTTVQSPAPTPLKRPEDSVVRVFTASRDTVAGAENDEWDDFGRMVSKILRRMPESDAREVQMEFFKILYSKSCKTSWPSS